MRAERLQPDQWQKPLDQPVRVAIDANEIRQAFFVDGVVEQADRQIAEAFILGQHRQQRLDHARAQSFADDHTFDVAGDR